jgi:hypothetical protein
MTGEESIDDSLVLRGQQAAGGVNHAAAGADQPGGGVENRRLLDRQLGDRILALPPFEVGIAAQRAEAGTRSVDQHAVDLAGQALDPGVALVLDADRMHIGQAGTRQARLQPGEALVGNVVGVEAAGVLHQGAEKQRLATGAGAEIDDHFAAFRLQQVAEQLAAFVLDLESAVEKQRMPGQRRLVAQADGQRRQAARDGGDPSAANWARSASRDSSSAY